MDLVVYVPPVITHVAQHSVHIGGAVDKTILVGQSGRGTGKILWPAAELLSEYISQPTSDSVFASALGSDAWAWKGKRVLELGAGLGLLTSTLLFLGATVLSTDGELTVVDQMNKNLLLNKDAIVAEWGAFNCDGLVFEWGEDTTALTDSLAVIQSRSRDGHSSEGQCVSSLSPHFDVIVASDVVYGSDMTVWDKLLQSLVDLTKTTSGESVLILIAQTERYKSSEDMFYTRAAEVLRLVDVLDLSGYATSCIHPGMKSLTRLYIFANKNNAPEGE